MAKIKLNTVLTISSEMFQHLVCRNLLAADGSVTDDFICYLQECIARDDSRIKQVHPAFYTNIIASAPVAPTPAAVLEPVTSSTHAPMISASRPMASTQVTSKSAVTEPVAPTMPTPTSTVSTLHANEASTDLMKQDETDVLDTENTTGFSREEMKENDIQPGSVRKSLMSLYGG